jgi:hypothetical protein
MHGSDEANSFQERAAWPGWLLWQLALLHCLSNAHV